ncbi:hypothetical protein JCM8547_003711 [Rhodosporidiobolus lusitaniae]
MPTLQPADVPRFLAHLSRRFPPSRFPPLAPSLVPLLTSLPLSHASLFLRPCLNLALHHLPLTPSPVPPEPRLPFDDAQLHPRRFVVRQFKEALVKSAVLVGVPRAIECLLEVQECVDEGDRSRAFVRGGLDEAGKTLGERKDAGTAGLRIVYKHHLDEIFTRMHREGLDDLRFLSQSVTYGTFLTPFPPFSPHLPSHLSPDPLACQSDPRLLSLITLPLLLAQRTPREILWHLRGALRLGWRRDEVEVLQGAVEEVAEKCGVRGIGEGVPRVRDVEVQEEERQRADRER